MGKRKCIFVMLTVMTLLLAMMGTAYGAAKEVSKKDWNIAFLGTLAVPEQLEIVDSKDVIGQFMKFIEKATNAKNKRPAAKTFSPEEIAAAFDDNNIGLYELALKNNGTYNTALVFAGKMPEHMNTAGITFFDKLKSTDKKQQEEFHKLILQKMDEAYVKVPDLKDVFQLEILEFYPIEQITNKNAQIVSIGGSVAVRTFKLIQPAAFKVYLINKDSQLYVFGVIGSGLDRKMWEDITKDMLSNARWSWL